jgi:peptide/nickel transport system substrate-binding protein
MQRSAGPQLLARRITRRRLIRTSAVAGFSTAFLAACGGSSNNNNKNASSAVPISSTRAAAATSPAPAVSPASGAAPGTAAAAAPAGKPGGTVHFSLLPTDPTGFDPYADFNYQSHATTSFYFSRLYTFRTLPDKPGSYYDYIPVSDAAQALPEITDNGQTYVIKLRPDIVWQNLPPMNGRALTAADVKFDADFFIQNAQSRDILGSVIDSVQAPDATTVVFKLKFPYVALTNLLAAPQYFYLLPPESLQKDGNVKNTHVGSGAFLFDTYEPGVRLTYKKNPTYYNKPYPYVDAVEGFIINDPNRVLSLFQSGQLNFMSPTIDQVPTIKKSKPDATIVNYIINSMSFSYFLDSIPANRPPFNDPRARQAVSLLLDRDGFAKLFFNGQGIWDNVINAGMGVYYLDPKGKDIGDTAQWFKFDPQKAKQLLQAAGYNNSTEVNYHYSPGYGKVFESQAEAVLAMLKDGFNLKAIPEDYPAYIANTFAGKGSGMVYGLQTPLTDPDLMLNRMFSPDNPLNNSHVNDPQINSLLDAQRKEFDKDKRKGMVWDIQRRNAEMMYYVPGVKGYTYDALSPQVKNYQQSEVYGFGQTVTDLWLAS